VLTIFPPWLMVGSMEAVLEHKPIFRFTKENARLFSAQGWQKSKEVRASQKADAEKFRQASPQADRLASQIGLIEEKMRKENDASELSKLASAHDKLFRAWQVLTGTPNPGSRRARQDRPRPPEVHRSPIPTPQKKTN
jgi:hypothetical protein